MVRRRILPVMLALPAVMACGEVSSPAEPEMAPSMDEVTIPDKRVDEPVTLQGSALTPDCGRVCQITVGETKLVGWLIVDGAAGAAAIRGAGSVSIVVGGSDTIPAPPAPRQDFRAMGSVAATQYAQIVAALPGSDTIPAPPPSPFTLTAAGDALYVMSVDDLVAKGILPRHSGGAETEITMIWTVGGRAGTTFNVVGKLPPSDTIPAPPVPPSDESK